MSDPCECLFNHKAMISRLLSLLRDAQTECADSDCMPTGSGVDSVGVASGGSNIMLIGMMWGLFAMLMFFFRPSSMRSDSRQDVQIEGKPHIISAGNNNNEPPAPDVH